MSEESELDCVSCETTFDPSPTGGFCPDCDTPHPEFGHSTVDDDDRPAEETDADEETDDASSDETSGAGSVDETTGEPTPGTESEMPDEPEEGSADDPDASSSEPAAEEDDDAAVSADDVPTHCPDCGARILGEDEASDTDASDVDSEDADDSDADDGDELTACPDCGRGVSDEAYCPDCGTDLAARRDQEEDEADRSEEQATEHRETEAVTSDDQVPTDSVTLVVNGERYEIADGDTFGRADEAWLDDLVVASGGSQGVSYVSSEHLAFSFEKDGIYVTDQSRNGTMHNGTDLDGGRTRVEDGDYLTLAKRAEIKIEF
jgi:hypothetical protein